MTLGVQKMLMAFLCRNIIGGLQHVVFGIARKTRITDLWLAELRIFLFFIDIPDLSIVNFGKFVIVGAQKMLIASAASTFSRR